MLENMDIVIPEMYEKKIQGLQIKPKSIRLPKYIQILLRDNKINDIENDDDRARLFIKLLFKQKLRGSTINKYYQILKPTLFPTTTVIPNSMVFDQASNSSAQMRGSNFQQIDLLISYVRKLDDKIYYKWSILFALYTGLRSSEVIQLKPSHLLLLLQKSETIPIIRKNNNSWKVLYYSEFEEFIKEITKHFQEAIDFYTQYNVDVVLFNFTTQALHYKLKEYCTLANNGVAPPCGFGLHIFRYYVASKLAKEKLDVAQIFLAHKNKKTTERYIRYNNLQKEQELETINQKSELYKNVNIKLLNNIKSFDTQPINYIEI
ncbi:Integrase [Dikerogammarus haemobaphes nudivirus]|nr:Integrase [Dikerogammarus haemobaphes nudivirus]